MRKSTSPFYNHTSLGMPLSANLQSPFLGLLGNLIPSQERGPNYDEREYYTTQLNPTGFPLC